MSGDEEAKECPSSPREPPSRPTSKSDEEEAAEAFLQKLNVIVVDAATMSAPPSPPDHDTTLDPKEYRNHFETLLGALKCATAREAGLHDQCRELQRQCQTAARSSNDRTAQIEELQNDLETVKSLLESANGREDRARVSVGKLQDELERLTDLVDKGEIAAARRESEITRLAGEVDEWKNQATMAADKTTVVEMERNKVHRQLEQLQRSYAEEREGNVSLEARVSERDAEVKRGNERRERAEKELEASQSKLETKTKECVDAQHSLHLAHTKAASLEHQLKEAKKAIGTKDQELKEEGARTMQVTASLHQQREKTSTVASQLAGAEQAAKKAAVQFNQLTLERTQLERNCASLKATSLRHQQCVSDARAAARASGDEAHSLKKELDALRKRETQFHREVLMLKRENAVATGRVQLTEEQVKKSGQDLQHKEQITASLEKELAEARDADAKQQLVVRRLEGEVEGLRHQAKDSEATMATLKFDLKITNNRSKDLTKAVEEFQSQIEAMKKKEDTDRVELNHSLKDLAAAQREIRDFELDKKSSQKLIDTLRSEIAAKESAMARGDYDCRKEKAQKELYADEVSMLKRSMAENESTIQTHQSELSRLGTTIRKLEDTLSGQRREYDHVTKERDILGTQLLRRNDELALLYEKIKILQSTQRRGELQYNAALDDIRILKIKVRDLQRQLAVSQGGQAGHDNLSRQLTLVQKELMRERLKVKALSDEMENPINVHRWRKLEGSDPEAFEMLQKIQILQKRLLQKSQEVVEKNSIIKQHEHRQRELEQDLARQPGKEVAREMNAYGNEIRKKSRQMKAMASELNMHQAQCIEYKREIEKHVTELHHFKRKYYALARRDALAREKELDSLPELAPSALIKPFHDPNKTRFVGGGFAIK